MSGGATGTASTSFFGPRARTARNAARVVAPVATPSSTTMAICPFASGRIAASEIEPAATLDLFKFARARLLKFLFADIGHGDHVIVTHHDRIAAVRNRAHCEFRLEGHADFPDEHEIEGRVQQCRDRLGDGRAAARQREDDDILALEFFSSAARRRPASVRS